MANKLGREVLATGKYGSLSEGRTLTSATQSDKLGNIGNKKANFPHTFLLLWRQFDATVQLVDRNPFSIRICSFHSSIKRRAFSSSIAKKMDWLLRRFCRVVLQRYILVTSWLWVYTYVYVCLCLHIHVFVCVCASGAFNAIASEARIYRTYWA